MGWILDGGGWRLGMGRRSRVKMLGMEVVGRETVGEMS